METITAKKGNGLSDLFTDYVPQQLEEQQKVIVTGSGTSALQKVCQKYDRGVKDISSLDWNGDPKRFVQNPNYRLRGMRIKEVLMPIEINSLVQSKLADNPCRNVGLFLSKMIQNSYLAGFNDFDINIANLGPIISFPFYLASAREDPLRITLRGKVDEFCKEVSGATVTLYGPAGYIYPRIRSSDVTIYGNLYGGGCFSATDSVFTFHGKILSSDRSGSSEIGFYAERCIFRTSDVETLEKLRTRVSCDVFGRKMGGHKIVFIKPDGSEETVRNFHYDG